MSLIRSNELNFTTIVLAQFESRFVTGIGHESFPFKCLPLLCFCLFHFSLVFRIKVLLRPPRACFFTSEQPFRWRHLHIEAGLTNGKQHVLGLLLCTESLIFGAKIKLRFVCGTRPIQLLSTVLFLMFSFLFEDCTQVLLHSPRAYGTSLHQITNKNP